jgi:eukaryotic-like serine/threonine-protein kinase
VGTLDYLRYGPALVEQGDTQGYEKFRQATVAHFTRGTYPFADRIIKISLLLPANHDLLKSLRIIADASAPSSTNAVVSDDDIFLAAWRSVSLGLMEYRSGNYVEAAEWCNRCLSYPEHITPRTETARVILAMASFRLGKTSDARSELAQARQVIEAKYQNQLERGSPMQGFWFDWAFARILLREAEGLIPANQ